MRQALNRKAGARCGSQAASSRFFRRFVFGTGKRTRFRFGALAGEIGAKREDLRRFAPEKGHPAKLTVRNSFIFLSRK
jgi:hypothetical protein